MMNEKKLIKMWEKSSSFRDFANEINWHIRDITDEICPPFDNTDDEYIKGYKAAVEDFKKAWERGDNDEQD